MKDTGNQLDLAFAVVLFPTDWIGLSRSGIDTHAPWGHNCARRWSMARYCRVLAGSFLLCAMPLSAEIVPISITQQVSVSGSALACDPLCQEFGIGLPDSGQTFS